MNIIAKNNIDAIVSINDLGISILPDDQIDLSTLQPYKVSSSDNLVAKISDGSIVINDGDDDLSVTDAIKYVIMQKSTTPVDPSGKQRVHQTSRPEGLITYFTGSGDDPEDIYDVGGGQEFVINHSINDSTNQYIYMDFNTITNETWIHEGYVTWNNAEFDTVSVDIVPRVTQYEFSQGTNYLLYNGYMIIPVDGTNGNVTITSDLTNPHGGLVYIPKTDEGIQPTSFWNATWDDVDGCYKDITPAPYGNGKFNLFTVEISLARFVNRFPFVGQGFQKLQSSDIDKLGQGMRIRSKATTNVSTGNHNWSIACALTLYRKRTV